MFLLVLGYTLALQADSPRLAWSQDVAAGGFSKDACESLFSDWFSSTALSPELLIIRTSWNKKYHRTEVVNLDHVFNPPDTLCCEFDLTPPPPESAFCS